MFRISTGGFPVRNVILVAAAVIACGDRSRLTGPVGLELAES